MSDGTTVFIGGLSDRVRDRDIEDFFDKFGKVTQIRLRDRYGFVDFDDRRDAEDAIKDLDGSSLCGERVRLELANRSRGSRRSGSRDRGRRDRGDDRRGSNRPHRTRYTLEVENLSSRVSWADLKDMMRKAGEVTYTDAHQRMGKNRGEVCFANSEDLNAAFKKFDGEDVNGRRLKLKITEDGSQSRSRSRSRSRGRRSRSRSARRSRSPRRSRSRSARRSRSRSAGRDRKRRSRSDSRDKGRDSRRGGSRSRSRSR